MRKAKARLTPEDVAELLGVPPGHQVVAMQVMIDPPSLTVLCEGPTFPDVAPNAEAPIAPLKVVPVHSRLEIAWPEFEEPF